MTDYNVNFTDPAVPAITVTSRTVNGPGSPTADTTLRIFGDGHTNWGEAVNENFVRLLEHFMGATAPINPVTGQIWAEAQLYYLNTATSTFYMYDVVPTSPTYHTWITISVTSQATAPVSPTIGMYWYNTVALTLNLYASAYDTSPAVWMVRSHATGTVAPTGTPALTMHVYDAFTSTWVGVSAIVVTDSTAAPSAGIYMRFAPLTSTVYLWNGAAWVALVDSGSPVFTGNVDMGNHSIINLADAVNPTDAVNLQTADGRYVNTAGDTMTGALILNADPAVALGAATKQYVDTTTAPVIHTHTLASITDAGTAAAYNVGILPTNLPTVADINGKHTIWIPAGALTPRPTSGPGALTFETSVNKVAFKTLAFDAVTEEYAQFSIVMPKSWDGLTVTAEAIWSHSVTSVNFGVVWGISAVAFATSGSLDVAFGVEQLVAGVGGVTDTLYITAPTAAITIAGTPAPGNVVSFQVARRVNNGADTMAIDARLHGIAVYYNTSALNDA